MTTRVVNVRFDKCDVYVGRHADPARGAWGNPYTFKAETLAFHIVPKEDVLTLYEKWLRSQPDMVAKARRELRGRVLGCFCAPRGGFKPDDPVKCHGQILATIADEEE